MTFGFDFEGGDKKGESENKKEGEKKLEDVFDFSDNKNNLSLTKSIARHVTDIDLESTIASFDTTTFPAPAVIQAPTVLTI